MTAALKQMWLEANLAGSSTTPSVSTIAAFVSAKSIKRINVDLTTTLNAGLIPYYDHVWLAQLRAAVVPLGCELWAAVGGSTVDHDAAAYACATAGLRARMAADLNIAGTAPNWTGTTAKTTALFHGFAADLEPWVNAPWPILGGAFVPSNAQEDNYLSIINNTCGELRTIVAGYKLYYNGSYTATNAPPMKVCLHTSHWLNGIGWHGAAPATDNIALHALAWPDEVDIMTHNTGTTQQSYSVNMLVIAQGKSNILKSHVSWLAGSFANNAALVADLDARYTAWLAAGYSKVTGCDVYMYAGNTGDSNDWASK